MCLLVFSLRADGCLVLIGNRDESYDRPTAALSFWQDSPEILAGRDLVAGGTWLGVTRAGRVAALTNFRRGRAQPKASSRGEVVSDFLGSSQEPEAFMRELRGRADRYAGFSLVAGQADRFFYFSNVDQRVRALTPGSYGLSNSFLDTPWPKVVAAKTALQAAIARGETSAARLSDLLLDRAIPADAELPDTGVGLEFERLLASSFIVTPDYGTRSATALVLQGSGEVEMYEKNYGRGGVLLSEGGQRFTLQPQDRPRAKAAK
jgi:uncharacterized protein with NRDE domain